MKSRHNKSCGMPWKRTCHRLLRPGVALLPEHVEDPFAGYDAVGNLSLTSSSAVLRRSAAVAAATIVPSATALSTLFKDRTLMDGNDASTEEKGTGADRLAKNADSDAQRGVHLLRAIQRAGLCSRRAALEKISSGHVRVNQAVVRDPFHRVTADSDLHLEGFRDCLRFAPPRLWLFHKPMFTLVGQKDDPTRVWFMRYAQMLGHEHLMPIGSMPFKAHGLMMLTNDGDLAGFLSHPQAKVQQTYVMRVRPAISPLLAQKLNGSGIDINGVIHNQFEFSHFNARKSKYVVRVRIRDSQAIPIHVMLQHLGRTVIRASRRSIGPFYVGGLAPGSLKEVALPPFYAKYVNSVWQPFIDRDWPYFRRLRLEKLRVLGKYRNLTDAERTELDTFAADELRQMSTETMSEVDEEASRFAESIRQRPELVLPDLPPPRTDEDIDQF